MFSPLYSVNVCAIQIHFNRLKHYCIPKRNPTCSWCRILFFFFFLQWILSYIEMKQPWVYMCSPSRWSLPPPSPPSPSRFSQLLQLSRVRVCASPQKAAHQALPSLGFSRQEHSSGLSYIAINDYYIKRYICTSNFCSGFQNSGRVAGDGQDLALNHRDLCFLLVIDD